MKIPILGSLVLRVYEMETSITQHTNTAKCY